MSAIAKESEKIAYKAIPEEIHKKVEMVAKSLMNAPPMPQKELKEHLLKRRERKMV